MTPHVSVVTIFYNAERFISDAIASVFAQTFEHWELILVDDGSHDRSTDIARAEERRAPERVRYTSHPGRVNRGMSLSRRAGVELARGTLVAFLDADDVWLPTKLEEQVARLTAEPRASAVYGSPLYWHGWTGRSQDAERDHSPSLGFSGDRLFEPPELLFLTAPLGTGPVPCPSDILIRREAFDRVGGSEPRFRGAYEDVALFVKLYLHEPVLATSSCWTRYRIHAESCMAVTVREGRYQAIKLFFLNWFEEYLAREGRAGTEAWASLQRTLCPYRHAIGILAMSDEQTEPLLNASPNPVPADSSQTTVSWSIDDQSSGQVWVSLDDGSESLFAEGPRGSQEAGWINPGVTYDFRLYAGRARERLLASVRVARLLQPGVGGESFGSLRRVVPVSRTFGFDRGQPIDRYYIDQFLRRHAADVAGHVLEIGESTYTRRFGRQRVSAVDVLHITEGNPEATIVGDLSDGRTLPSSTFDCIVLIQTLHLVFDLPAAIATLHRILKPGAIVLATFPGISPISRDQWRESWYWGLTKYSARRLFGRVFPDSAVTVTTYGNVLAASAFLYGLASSELSPQELDYADDCYEALVAIRAVKGAEA